jgi:hypothetical protein
MFVYITAAFDVNVFPVMFVTPEAPILMRPEVITFPVKVLFTIEIDLALF